MKKYQLYWLTTLTVLCLLSLTISVCAVVDYTFLAESFIGIIATYIGVAITIVIGYQIFSVIEFRDDLKTQKNANEGIIKENMILQRKITEQQQSIDKYLSRLEESKNMLYALYLYKDEDDSFRAFSSMHLALLYALDCESEDIDDILSNLRIYVNTLCGHYFGITGCAKTKEGVCYINSPQHIFYKKTVKEFIDYCMTKVWDVDKKIRIHTSYKNIHYEYESIMCELVKKLEWISRDPCNVDGQV